MKQTALCLAVILALSGCSTMQNPDTFAKCKTVDIASTALLLKSGAYTESNGLVAGTLAHGYFPLIALSYAIYRGLEYMNNPAATETVNAVTCTAAVNNLLLF
jgi:hypothetical protein